MKLKRVLKLIPIFLLIINIGCEKKDDNNKLAGTMRNNLAVPENALFKATEILGDEVKHAFYGNFDGDELNELAVGLEINDNENWGIKFSLLKENDKKFNEVFYTKLLDGSFRESMTQKIKFPSFPYELIYYNSRDYFLGSGGGEVFSYIIDFNKKEIYYAHLVSETRKGVSLFLSENIKEGDIKNFFLNLFKKDFPKFSLIDKDITLD